MPSEEEFRKARDEEREDGFGILPGVPEASFDDLTVDWEPGNDRSLLESGQIIGHHARDVCSGSCCLHGTTSYQSCRMPRKWRSDVGILEHECPHGIGHPCRAGQEYAILTGRYDGDGIHGCDGCCREDWHNPMQMDAAQHMDSGESLLEQRLVKVESISYWHDVRAKKLMTNLEAIKDDIDELESRLNKRIVFVGLLLLAYTVAVVLLSK